MRNALADIPIIDVDTHYTEPPDLWTSLAPASLKARAPRVTSDKDGNQSWIVDESLQLGPVGYCVIRADGSKALGTTTLLRMEEMHPGATDTDARLRVMDERAREQGVNRVSHALTLCDGPIGFLLAVLADLVGVHQLGVPDAATADALLRPEILVPLGRVGAGGFPEFAHDLLRCWAAELRAKAVPRMAVRIGARLGLGWRCSAVVQRNGDVSCPDCVSYPVGGHRPLVGAP